MSAWRNYRGRCVGRIPHFLYHYCGLDLAESSTIGESTVHYHGQEIARFGWSNRFGEKDVPEFTFYGVSAGSWRENQRQKREQAILDALPPIPNGYRIPVEIDVVYAMQPTAAQSSNLWAQIFEDTQPEYFVSSDRILWAKAKLRLIYWSRELGEWLLGPQDHVE